MMFKTTILIFVLASLACAPTWTRGDHYHT
jgi:hypothetical protein